MVKVNMNNEEFLKVLYKVNLFMAYPLTDKQLESWGKMTGMKKR